MAVPAGASDRDPLRPVDSRILNIGHEKLNRPDAAGPPAQTTAETERARRIWDKKAPGYDKEMSFFDRHLFVGGREWACSQATGKVLELAVGTGRNLEFYPDRIDLTGIELSPAMLGIAKARATELSKSADLRLGDAQALDLPDGSFDIVICTFSLCSIPDDGAAVREAKRVLKPGGRFILMEHVGSPNPLVRAIQHLIDLFSVRLEGDHQCREPLNHLQAEGFEVEYLERSKWGIVERVTAKKPA